MAVILHIWQRERTVVYDPEMRQATQLLDDEGEATDIFGDDDL